MHRYANHMDFRMNVVAICLVYAHDQAGFMLGMQAMVNRN